VLNAAFAVLQRKKNGGMDMGTGMEQTIPVNIEKVYPPCTSHHPCICAIRT
jgi:hypothetical protein